MVRKPTDVPKAVKTKEFEYRNKKTLIAYEKPKIIVKDPLQMELLNFVKSIKGESEPIVSGEKAKEALKVALDIQKAIKQDLN